MSDIQKAAIEALKLCEHGNYHCMICEVRLLKLVIAEQTEEIIRKDAEIEKLREFQRAITLTPMQRMSKAMDIIAKQKGAST